VAWRVWLVLQVMFPADHEDALAAVDRIPIENSMGTQYFMDVTIGSPKQKFTGAQHPPAPLAAPPPFSARWCMSGARLCGC